MAILNVPYNFYVTALTQGVQSEYLNLNRLPDQYYHGGVLKFQHFIGRGEQRQGLWKDFHFSNFIVPFPIHHPQIVFLPQIKEKEGLPDLGAIFMDTSHIELFSFITDGVYPFKILTDKEKLFAFPIAKKIVYARKMEEIWADLFTKDVLLNVDRSHHLLSFPPKISGLEMPLYDLFLINMRKSYFEKEQLLDIHYYSEKQMGVLEVFDIDERYMSEVIHYFYNGVVYRVKIRTKRWDVMASMARDRFLQTIRFEESSPDSSQKIYTAFKSLSFYTQIRQEGLAYLYASWSHVLDRKEFLREMITFLERGKENYQQLTPLYEYAHGHFGTTFSKLGKHEVLDEKLKRKIAEELEKEILHEQSKQADPSEGDFPSPEAKIKYFLNKAKQEKTNSDEMENRLDR